MPTPLAQIRLVLLSFALSCICSASAQAQQANSPAANTSLADLQIPGVKITIESNTVLIQLTSDFEGQGIEVPRLAAPVRSLKWQGVQQESNIKLQPELTTWKLNWDQRPAANATLEMQLDAPPKIISQVPAIEVSGDGSLFLPAHLAVTTGDKIRYEPQPFKNTVGYWAGMQNSASWKVKIDRPGKFNVAILQGCGAGNGGSDAEIALIAANKDAALNSLDFVVQETGHFQNFVWRHLGEWNITQSGEFDVRIRPRKIAKGALMDVRAVHLIRLP